MHLQPVFKGWFYTHKEEGTTIERLFERGLCLPSGSNQSTREGYLINLRSCNWF